MLCVRVWVGTHQGSCGVPGSPVFTERKCLSRQIGRKLAVAWTGRHTQIQRDLQKHTLARNNVKRGIWRELRSLWVRWIICYRGSGSDWVGHWLFFTTLHADYRIAIDSSPVNLREQGHSLPGLSTPIHTSCLHHQLYSFNSYICCCKRHLIDYMSVSQFAVSCRHRASFTCQVTTSNLFVSQWWWYTYLVNFILPLKYIFKEKHLNLYSSSNSSLSFIIKSYFDFTFCTQSNGVFSLPFWK